jgi:inner membrane protein YidH
MVAMRRKMKNQEITNNIFAEERTLLAAERTFSAWIRTALAAMAGGLAILRLIIFKSELHRIIAHIIGETLIVWGCVLIILSAIDYKKTRDKLISVGSYKGSLLGFLVVVVPLLLMSTLLIWVTLP